MVGKWALDLHFTLLLIPFSMLILPFLLGCKSRAHLFKCNWSQEEVHFKCCTSNALPGTDMCWTLHNCIAQSHVLSLKAWCKPCLLPPAILQHWTMYPFPLAEWIYSERWKSTISEVFLYFHVRDPPFQELTSGWKQPESVNNNMQ